jgi:DNA-binding CsgD family transcriptional regulator
MVTASNQLSRQVVNIDSRVRIPDVDTGNIYSSNIVEDMQLVTHILNLGQALCEQTKGGIARLCHEVKYITDGRAQLCFGRQRVLKRSQSSATTIVTLPVQFGNLVYGTLCVTSDPTHQEQLSIPLPVAQLLAQACSWLLYTLEQSAFLQGQCEQLDYQINGPLTKREREVLALMCQGYNQETIANMLCIAIATVGKHRQHIYEQLGVHCERDALLVAYQIGLFSLIEDNVYEV